MTTIQEYYKLKQQQEIKTYIYDNATGEWDSTKFNTLSKQHTHIDGNIKLNDVGNKICYYLDNEDKRLEKVKKKVLILRIIILKNIMQKDY